MKEVKINIPEGYTIDEKNSTFECIKFKRKELPKTWEEFCANNPTKRGEFFVNGDCRIYEYLEGQRNPIADANVLPNREYAEAILALCKLIQLRDCYNDGWQPNLVIIATVFKNTLFVSTGVCFVRFCTITNPLHYKIL